MLEWSCYKVGSPPQVNKTLHFRFSPYCVTVFSLFLTPDDALLVMKIPFVWIQKSKTSLIMLFCNNLFYQRSGGRKTCKWKKIWMKKILAAFFLHISCNSSLRFAPFPKVNNMHSFRSDNCLQNNLCKRWFYATFQPCRGHSGGCGKGAPFQVPVFTHA